MSDLARSIKFNRNQKIGSDKTIIEIIKLDLPDIAI